ncbi:hypothetical protein J2Z66_008532 [Paenibacillus eucommiae]|uniref:Uncharacterized protein n=1 Tax=Paenibacillus eucommiae TaxID=1355755 RepID=A0ABS4JDQ9_9BACL|nr:hypothetical protein [Paenibacillus eucommiae]
MWSGTYAFNDEKIIVKVEICSRSFSAGARSSVPAALARGKSPPSQRKTHAGSPFELGVRTLRAIVAEKREGLWVEER